MKDLHETIIIGAGAAGLMAAYSACRTCIQNRKKTDVLILERKEVAGKKITATGNGKCNFTNRFQDERCYRSNDPEKAFRIVKRFDNDQVIEFFNSIGIISRERNGYCYPYGEQAKSVRDVLCNLIIGMGVEILTEKNVTEIVKLEKIYSKDKIEKKESYFVITCSDGSRYLSKKVIICAGGKAAPAFGTDGTIFEVLKKIGLKLINPRPALCGLKTDIKSLRLIEGVRLKCNCYLYSGEVKNIIYSEAGEIIFSKNGISGIPVMNLSRFAVNELAKRNKCGLLLDMFPDIQEEELADYLFKVVSTSGGKAATALSAIINDKMLKVIFKDIGFSYDTVPDSLSLKTLKIDMKKLAGELKHYNLNITGDAGFENAQTTQGGVDLSEINEETMECKKFPGMYLAGEVLDVDGMCGGYNLQWAWSTGFISGRSCS